MLALGISYSADAGAAVLEDGKILFAVNEERLNRQKLCHGVPRLSIESCLSFTGLRAGEFDTIATIGGCSNHADRLADFHAKHEQILASDLDTEVIHRQVGALWQRFSHEEWVIRCRTRDYLQDLRKYFAGNYQVFDHHLCHATGAYFYSGFDEAYVLTVDGWGEDGSSALCHGSGGKLKRLGYSPTFASLGYFYGMVTKYLGFIPHRHEGKVLGLAAHGDPDRFYGPLREMIDYNAATRRFDARFEGGVYLAGYDNPNLGGVLEGGRREDIAAATQKVLEDVVVAYVRDNVPAGSRLAVAGGIFANVLLNQRILQHTDVAELFVFPHMGDGGLGIGAAAHALMDEGRIQPGEFGSPYLGPSFSAHDIEKALETEGLGLEVRQVDDMAETAAGAICQGKVIARFDGAMELGPRALGNRSIMYSAEDPGVNLWLNEKLNRSEFMPFAPVTLAEHADACYQDVGRAGVNTRYMTITLDCTDFMRQRSPGCVHVDGTARPQIIREEDNPGYYAILRRYHEKSGIPTLINTSFNMHEEPIVCTPEDALRGFRQSGLPALVMGDFFVTNPKATVSRDQGSAGS